MKITTVRGRTVAATMASLALVGTGATLATAPAQSAPVEGACDVPFPASELAPGDTVHGLTVSRGTEPDAFTGEIIGTIPNGIALGVPLVMAELASPALTEAGGVWSGMSGSPVYADSDDRLIGAVSATLIWGNTPVAGITPFENMDDYLAGTAAATRIPVSPKQARAIAAATDVSRAQAEQGFTQLPLQATVSGIADQRLRKVQQQGPDYLGLDGMRASGTVTADSDAGPETLEPGGNLGVAYSYGDITSGGVGTVTSVCEGELVGFGHPFAFTGKTVAGMMPAEAIFVQSDPIGSAFKVASMGAPAGTITQDRSTGVTGQLGELPEETEVVSRVTYGGRWRDGSSASLAPAFNADTTFLQVLYNQDAVIDAYQGGSSDVDLTITGTDAQAHPFQVVMSDRYTSPYDISFESVFDTADLVYALSGMKGVTVASIDSQSTVTDVTARWRLTTVEQRLGGGWVKLTRRTPALVKAGKTLRLRGTLVSDGDTRLVPISVAVPRRSRRSGYLEVRGGGSDWSSPASDAKTPADVVAALAEHVRNDQVVARLIFPRRGAELVRSGRSAEQSQVVTGRRSAQVIVRR